MTEPMSDVMASYYRCRGHKGFVDTFYKFFVAKSPEIAAKFSETDFRVQKRMLRESLLEMLCFDRGMKNTEQEIRRLGRRHRELDITPEMYEQWLDSLCEAVRQHDPEYRPDLDTAWRQAMQKGIALMLASDDNEV